MIADLLDGRTLHVTSMSNNKILSFCNDEWSAISIDGPRGITASKDGVVRVVGSDGIHTYRSDGTRASTVFPECKIDGHDAYLEDDDELLVSSALMSAVVGIDASGIVREHWRVPDVDASNDNRSHMSGACPGWVTVLGISNDPGGWRPTARNYGGSLIDTENNKIVVSDLLLPHSPVEHLGEVWFLHSGLGELRTVSRQKSVDIPGFPRGLCFLDDRHAVIGISQGRFTAFPGLTVDLLAPPGIALIDTESCSVALFVPLDVREIFALSVGPAPLVSS